MSQRAIASAPASEKCALSGRTGSTPSNEDLGGPAGHSKWFMSTGCTTGRDLARLGIVW